MLINFWECEFQEYDESWDGEEETRFYMCKHPNGTGSCDLDNKYCVDKDDCKLLDQEKQNATD